MVKLTSDGWATVGDVERRFGVNASSVRRAWDKVFGMDAPRLMGKRVIQAERLSELEPELRRRGLLAQEANA